MAILTNQSGVWKDSKPRVNDGGVWKEAKEGFVKDGGVWQSVYKNLPSVPGTPFGGGYYVGRIQQDDGPYILVVSPKSAESTRQWKSVSSGDSGVSSTYDGLANSNAVNVAPYYAVQWCRFYRGGDFDDWYLPAKDELEICYRYLKPTALDNLVGYGGANTRSIPVAGDYTASDPAQTGSALFMDGGPEAFTTGTPRYWSSTQHPTTPGGAWTQHFNQGYIADVFKIHNHIARPVRRIKI